MTSLERVLAAMAGEAQERPPFTMTLSLYGSKLTGCSRDDYYSNPVCYAEGQEAVYELFRPDIIFAPFAIALEAAAFGSHIHSDYEGPPYLRQPFIHSPDEFRDVIVPDINNDPYLFYIRESLRILVEKYKGHVPICGIASSPIDMPAYIMGIDKWLETLIFNPAEAEDILDICINHFVAFSNALIEDGATFIAVPMMFINPLILFKKMIVEFLLPKLSSGFSQIKGPIIFHHGGNLIVPYLENYATLPNVAGFVIDFRDSFSEARDCLGEKTVILGNLNGVSLYSGTVNTVVARVNEILDDRKDDKYFIFATTGADVPLNTPQEHIQAISDTIRARRNT